MNGEHAFDSFYNIYAPKLWGLILRADLPPSQSEVILVNTLSEGWKNYNQNALAKTEVLPMLLYLAYQEGLPQQCLDTIFKSNL